MTSERSLNGAPQRAGDAEESGPALGAQAPSSPSREAHTQQLFWTARWVVLGAAIVLGLLFALYKPVQPSDGDQLCYLDTARFFLEHHVAQTVNAQWFPGYGAFLAVGFFLLQPLHTNPWQAAFYVNWIVYLAALAAMSLFVRGLLSFRQTGAGDRYALTPPVAYMAGTLAVLISWTGEQSLSAVHCDPGCMLFLLFSLGLALRFLRTGGWWNAVGLGTMLALAYYFKPSALPAAAALFALLLAYAAWSRRHRSTPAVPPHALARVVVAGVTMAVLMTPLVAAMSAQKHAFTLGDQGNLNYAWFIDGVTSTHPLYQGSTGHAELRLKHPELLLGTQPLAFSYSNHMVGTYPFWYDLSWFRDHTVTHPYLPGHLHRLPAMLHVLFVFVVQQPELLLLLGLVWLLGGDLRSVFREPVVVLLLVWGALQIAVYITILLYSRYITVPYFALLLPPLLLMRAREPDPARSWQLARAGAVLAAGVLLLQARFTQIVDVHQIDGLVNHGSARGYQSPLDYELAEQALQAQGMKPGDYLACTELSCGNMYWAFDARVQFVASVDDVVRFEPVSQLGSMYRELAPTGAKFLVTNITDQDPIPAGWMRLGLSHFYALPLAAEAAHASNAQGQAAR